MFLKIKLLSDTCIGSGESVAGVIDTDINFDKYGIPFLPAKRIKGLLKEAAVDLNELYLGDYTENINKLFGSESESEMGCLLFDNGYINEYSQLTEEIKRSKKGKYKNIFLKSIVKEYFTDVKVNTAIERESGVAKKGSLRNIRVIKSGIEFNIKIDSIKELNNKDKEILEKSIKIIRHMGMSRTRGLGQVELSINYIEDENLNEKKEVKYRNKNKLTYTIELLQPTIISENYINGGTILGIFASRYINENNINKNNAHKHEDFRKIFLDGEVKFLNAYPYRNDKIFYPTPLSIVKKKFNGEDEERDEVIDLANSEGKKIVLASNEQFKVISSQFSFIEKDYIDILDVESELYYHHKRPKDKAIGHATDEQGEYFQYTSVAKGEVFCGEIWAEQELLEEIRDLFRDEIIYIGKSRTSQYGKARIKLIENKEEEENEFDDISVITLRSPMILKNNLGYYSSDINDIILSIFGEQKEIISVHVKNKIVGGFNAKWGLPKIQSQAFQEGSVIVINEELDEDEIRRISNSLYGERTEEGFGQIAINSHGEEEQERLIINREEDSNIPDLVNILSEEGKKIFTYSIEKIIKNKLMLSVYDRNKNLATEIKEFLKGCNKAVGGNISLMLLKANNFEDFQEALEYAAKRSTKSEKNKINPYKKFIDISSENKSIKDIFKVVIFNMLTSDIKDGDILKDDTAKEIIFNDNRLYDLYRCYLNNILTTVKYEMRGE